MCVYVRTPSQPACVCMCAHPLPPIARAQVKPLSPADPSAGAAALLRDAEVAVSWKEQGEERQDEGAAAIELQGAPPGQLQQRQQRQEIGAAQSQSYADAGTTMISRGFEKLAPGLYSRPPLQPETANVEVSASGAASSRAAVTEQPTAAAEDEEEKCHRPRRRPL